MIKIIRKFDYPFLIRMDFISTLTEKLLLWEISDNYNKLTLGIEHENIPHVIREFGTIYHIHSIYSTKYIQLLTFGKKEVRF